jgi:transcriptional antiterminator NusG
VAEYRGGDFLDKGGYCFHFGNCRHSWFGRFSPAFVDEFDILIGKKGVMSKGWYVVHAYSGQEGKVEKQIHKLIESGFLSDKVFDVKVPSEEVVEVKDGKKKTLNKKFLPGYVLVEMDLPDIGWEEVCSEIKKIAGVTGFVGTNKNQMPRAISQDEAKSILQKTGEIKTDKMLKPKMSFSNGEVVRIVDGPFNSFTGTIEEVNQEKGKLRVMVGIFGRSTPVEVEFLQVEKL